MINYKQKIKNNIVKHHGEPQSLDDLARTVIRIIGKKRKVLGFAWEINLTDVRCSHDAPINGQTCWSSREAEDGRPTTYPGFHGRVWIRYAGSSNGFGSDPFESTLTYPGTGGFGSYDGPWKTISSAVFKRWGHRRIKGRYPEPEVYSWDYRFYLDDWPLIVEATEKAKVLALLKGTSMTTRHRFLWEDPETRAADRAFIKQQDDVEASL